MKKIWKDWVQYRIVDEIIKANKIELDTHSTMEIVGRPLLDSPRIFKMLLRGKAMNKYGGVKTAQFSTKRKDFVYKIIYKNDLALGKDIYFKADRYISKQVHEALISNNVFYRIEYVTE